MVILNLSSTHLRYAILQDNLIKQVNKKQFQNSLTPQDITSPELKLLLKPYFQEIVAFSPDKQLLISLPSEWSFLEMIGIDTSMELQDRREYLQWHLSKKFGNYQELFEHYFIPVKKSSPEFQEILILLIYRNLTTVITNLCRENGLTPVLVDLSLFSSYYALEYITRGRLANRIGIWKVNLNNSELAIFENGDFNHYLQFVIKTDGHFDILQSSSPNPSVLDIVDELSKLGDMETERVEALNEIYIYTDMPHSEFFNTLLAYQLENLKIINPLENLTIEQLDDSDGDSAVALCQYLETSGLIYRYLNGEV